MITEATFKDQLIELNACEDARIWAEGKTLEQAWNDCHRGDWMLWISRKAKNYDLQTLTLAKGHCANTVRHLMKDKRSTDAVDMAIKFGEGNATRDELNAYAAAAYAAYAAYADADADAYAAYAYAYADADAYAAAAYAAAAYADADAAAYAAYAYADADADAYAAAAYAAYAYAAAAYADADAAAAYAAAAYADADAYAVRQTARKNNQQLTADICRKYLPLPVL